jgi:hypothetical protein
MAANLRLAAYQLEKRPFNNGCRSWFVNVAPGMNGQDRWMVGIGNTIFRAWSMPRWLSWHKHVGRLRGG